MDRRELLDRTAQDAEERLLLSRVWDKREQCRQRNIPAATDFLSPQEQAAAQRLLNALDVREGYAFSGGYEGAERRRLVFLPDWKDAPDEQEITAVEARCRSGSSLTHRDFLGSLMALGLTRGKIGDILLTEGGCQVIVEPSVAEHLVQSWDSAGRERLTVAALPSLTALAPQAPVFTEVRDTVASLRLDGVASAGFGVSRGKAAEAIQRGAVQVNHTVCLKPDKPVAAGDIITCRGWGRCVLDSVGSPTRKGRFPIVIQRYS